MAYQAGLSADELEVSDDCSGLPSTTSTRRILNTRENGCGITAIHRQGEIAER